MGFGAFENDGGREEDREDGRDDGAGGPTQSSDMGVVPKSPPPQQLLGHQERIPILLIGM